PSDLRRHAAGVHLIAENRPDYPASQTPAPCPRHEPDAQSPEMTTIPTAHRTAAPAAKILAGLQSQYYLPFIPLIINRSHSLHREPNRPCKTKTSKIALPCHRLCDHTVIITYGNIPTSVPCHQMKTRSFL